MLIDDKELDGFLAMERLEHENDLKHATALLNKLNTKELRVLYSHYTGFIECRKYVDKYPRKADMISEIVSDFVADQLS